MVVRFVCIAIVTCVTLVDVAATQGNWFADIYNGMARDFKRRNCWPKPFNCPDRDLARAPFVKMVENGWRIQNMLSDHHFIDSSGELTVVGRNRVTWIVTEGPVQHRKVYVHRGATAEETVNRVDHVQQLVAQLVPEGPLPPVIETSVSQPSWPAERVGMINQKMQDSEEGPRIPFLQGGGADEE